MRNCHEKKKVFFILKIKPDKMLTDVLNVHRWAERREAEASEETETRCGEPGGGGEAEEEAVLGLFWSRGEGEELKENLVASFLLHLDVQQQGGRPSGSGLHPGSVHLRVLEAKNVPILPATAWTGRRRARGRRSLSVRFGCCFHFYLIVCVLFYAEAVNTANNYL